MDRKGPKAKREKKTADKIIIKGSLKKSKNQNKQIKTGQKSHNDI